MKYLLINQQTAEETLCDKVTIDGFDYYVSDELPSVGNKSILQVEGFSPMILTHFEKCESDYEGKKVIATNNPNLDIPQVVDEVDIMRKTLVNSYLKEIKDCTKRFFWKACFKHGYNKSQETHSFSDEDMIEFYEWCDTSAEANLFWRRNRIDPKMSGSHHKIRKQKMKELLQFWKEQKPKKIYYTQTTQP